MSDLKEPFNVPDSPSKVTVRLIDTGARRKVNASDLFKPAIPGFNTITIPSWSFLVSNNNTHVLFDLSIRKDWQTGFPPIFDPLIGNAPGDIDSQLNIHADNDVRDILDSPDHGLDLNSASVEAVIWSHHHFDHRGAIKTFPPSTHLVIGPGLRDTYLPSYPTDPEGELDESEFQGRTVRELGLEDFKVEIGGVPAYDYFGDGSFYLLNMPGHTTGHLAGLARTTSTTQGDGGGKSTFLFLAGDCAHHPAVFRPSDLVPLPEHISLYAPSSHPIDPTSTTTEAPISHQRTTTTYDSARILQMHPLHSATSPFLEVDAEPLCENHEQAVESVRLMQRFDGREDVLVCIAHDATLRSHLPCFPGTLDGWQTQGWKEKTRWEFLRDFWY